MTAVEAAWITMGVGLIAYVLTGGADLGGGIWDLLASGPRREQQRVALARALAPIWEANHVWLIFVLVICWTAYPEVFGAIFSTLWIPLILACFGIIMRGKNSAIPRLTIKFTCDPFPPEKAYELFISAQDDDTGKPSKFRILLNGVEIFSGDSPFPEYNWGVHKFPVPYDAFKRSNTLTIESLEEGIAANGPPWLIVNYIVLKP